MKLIAELRLQAVLENVPLAIECAGEWARQAGFDERAQHQIQVAVDEACANVVEHAYEGRPPGDMEISCYVDGPELVIRVRDWGAGFDPGEVPWPDLEAPLEERNLGGLGLVLIRKLMDTATFCCDPERGNELVMAKRRPGTTTGTPQPESAGAPQR